ncbi:MAG TPA: carboxymuconolactone decarboxylase family protein [Acidimicrobiales bacterium]|jgi:4-carboxymuconolactone decarboxylase|nr:carboxymuconolactone decarboxylase family protein [Acidimicrobiales bacterium]
MSERGQAPTPPAEPEAAAAEARAGRLPWLHPDELTAEQRAVYDAIVAGPRRRDAASSFLADATGRLEGPFNAMLFSPAVGAAVQALGAALRYRSALSPRQREVAVLEIAARLRSDFEWLAHEPLARRAGLAEVDLAALRTGVRAPGLERDEAAVRRAVASLVETGDLEDALFAELVEALGIAGCTDLVHLVGYYRMLALSLRAFRTPLPAGAHGGKAGTP